MKHTKLIPFSKRTAESIYLEFVNDWLTLDAMADNYNRPLKELQYIIAKGKIENDPILKQKKKKMELPLTYKVVCNLRGMDFYTDDEHEANKMFRKYVNDYGDGIRLYEAIKPIDLDETADWEVIDYYDGGFTGGEWSATNSNNKDYIDIDGESGRICRVYVGNDAPAENRANALLIQQSSKLYYTLEAFVLGLLHDSKTNPIHNSLMQTAKDVLAKASPSANH